MNNKLAKKLRKQALAETVGLPMCVYVQDTRRSKTKTGEIVVRVVGTRTLGDCTRRRYKELKKLRKS